MKAIQIQQLGAPDVLQLAEVATPQPAKGQVLIKVAASGINFADTQQRSGKYPLPLQLPSSLGFEVAGTIETVGTDVDASLIGKRIAVFLSTPTGYSEYVVADAGAVIPIPDALTFEQSVALLVQGLTAYFLLEEAIGNVSGKSILVHTAAGGVGSLAIQLAKIKGASLLIGTASQEKKLSLIRELGAHAAINYTEAHWTDQVKEATGGKGVDIILDAVNGDYLKQNLSVLAPFGRLVSYGSLSGGQVQLGNAELTSLIFKNQGIVGFSLYGISQDRTAKALQEIFAYAVSGRLQAVVGHVYPLAQAAQAHKDIEARQTTGKVVLVN
jgi:NADPH:quinone reductase